nr:MAG TPA: hypothetical protein [Caudoviricetes sp.]
MQNEDKNEIPKYKKKMKSNTSKSNRKSKHKHHYEECLIHYKFSFGNKNCIRTKLSSYCTICGKIGDRFKKDKSIVKDFCRKVDTSIGECYAIISDEELYEKYHDKLPVFFVEDYWKDGYVNLDENNK